MNIGNSNVAIFFTGVFFYKLFCLFTIAASYIVNKNKPLKISHGWMNSYSYKDSEKNISMSYNQLREKLVQQLTSI